MTWLDHVENFLIILVSRIAPWAAPLAPAYLYSKDTLDFVRLLLTYYAIYWTFYIFLSLYLIDSYPDVPYYNGFVYLLRRSDGILKIGCTIDLSARIVALRRDYETGFALVRAWAVRDRYTSERIALEMTKQFHYSEGRRLELRKMNRLQVKSFIRSFTGRIK
jgi:hypothetical protein